MRVVLAVAAALAAAVPSTGPAPAQLPQNCAGPGTAAGTSWAQQMLAPQRVWPLSRGAGVTVAVLDSGVDASQPQLYGRVAAGTDMAGGTGDSDCSGHG